LTNRYSYDPWGRPRDPGTWALLPISITDALANLNAMQPRFDRGYTGHEHLCGFGLINMNGRLYDPYLQRFLSPDNYVQSPFNAQNYNRYGYCLNNPLTFTDPTGEFIWFVPVIIGAVVGAYIGGSVQQGTAAFWKWDSDFYKQADFWKSVTIGAIVGAGVGALTSMAILPGASFCTAAGVPTTAWSMTSQALLWGNVNMFTSLASGGDVDAIFKAGLSGLAIGAVTGGVLSKWKPSNVFEYLAKRNISNNLDVLNGDDFKISAGLISFNVNKGKLNTILDGVDSFDDVIQKLGMIYETAGMMKFLPDVKWYKDYTRVSLVDGKLNNDFTGLKQKSINFKPYKNAASFVFNKFDRFYNENSVVNSFLTNNKNREFRELVGSLAWDATKGIGETIYKAFAIW